MKLNGFYYRALTFTVSTWAKYDGESENRVEFRLKKNEGIWQIGWRCYECLMLRKKNYTSVFHSVLCFII